MDFLKQRIVETIQWYHTRDAQLGPVERMRSTDLKPVVGLPDEFNLREHGPFDFWESWKGTPEESWAYTRYRKADPMEVMPAADYYVYLAETEGLISVHEWRQQSRWAQAKAAVRAAQRLATHFQRQSTVEALAIRRGQLLRRKGILPDQTEGLSQGRFLLCRDTDDSHVDGGAWAASKGLFDDFDLPPWDSWIFYAVPENVLSSMMVWAPTEVLQEAIALHGEEHPLLAWIPEAYFEATEEAIGYSIGDCLVWASDVDTPVTRTLQKLGFLS